jgi:hypothetical protein
LKKKKCRRKLVEASPCRQAWGEKKKKLEVLCKPFGQSKEKIVHRLNEVIYESEWVHLIWKKNGRCFGYIRRPYGQGEK